MDCKSLTISKKRRWQRPCNMHASISKLLNFYQLKKKKLNQRNTFKATNSACSYVLNVLLPTEVTKSIISHTLSPLLLCTQLIHGGMDSLGVALHLTARWAGLMWPTPSETLCWQPKAKKTVHWTAKASLGRCGWRALTVLMKCVNLDRAQCRGWYRHPGPDCGLLTCFCRFSGDDNDKALVSDMTPRHTKE